MKDFTRDGITLKHPLDWTLETEDSEDGWTTSVFSPGTAFLVVNYVAGADDPQALADQTMQALAGEYERLEAEPRVETIASLPAVGHDMHFFLYDLTNTAWTRCLPVPGGSLLLLAQATDDEMESHGASLVEMMATIQVED